MKKPKSKLEKAKENLINSYKWQCYTQESIRRKIANLIRLAKEEEIEKVWLLFHEVITGNPRDARSTVLRFVTCQNLSKRKNSLEDSWDNYNNKVCDECYENNNQRCSGNCPDLPSRPKEEGRKGS